MKTQLIFLPVSMMKVKLTTLLKVTPTHCSGSDSVKNESEHNLSPPPRQNNFTATAAVYGPLVITRNWKC